METTEQKTPRAEPSRVNGAKSKGAKTAEGQAKAKKGNYKHGAYAVHTTVLPGESMDGYNALLDDARAQFQPRNLFESQLVDEIVDLTWQIGRLKFLVTAQVAAAMRERNDKSPVGTRIDENMLAIEAAGSTPNGPITVLERRIKTYILLRTTIMSDLERLKKIPTANGPSPVVKIAKDFVNTFSFQLPENQPPQEPPAQPPPPDSSPSPDKDQPGGQT